MRIVTVIPISRGIVKDSLTYFTKKDVSIGSIVSIPLRKKLSYGLVIGSQDAAEIKTELKSLPYAIKKVDDIRSFKFLSDDFIEASQKIADYFATSVGAVLSTLIPKSILEESEKLIFEEKKSEKSFHETVLLQSDEADRFATYRSLIREEFAKSKSVFFCLPTTEDLLNSKGMLEKGIEKYTFILHSGLSKKEQISTWQKVTQSIHPVLIIATPYFLSIPKNDLGTIILEKESSRGYKGQVRPYLDFKIVAEMLAKQKNVRLVLGDTLLRVETLWDEKNGKYLGLSPLKFRSLETTNSEIISMKVPQDMKKNEFSIFSEKVKDLIRKSKENNEHTFLFCGRKGLFPITVCSDCGTVVICKNCNAPVVLYGKPKTSKDMRDSGNLFVCNHCGERRSAHELCRKCGGWRLNPLGIGTERVAEEVLNLFPDSKVLLMDKEHVKNHKQAAKIRDLFYATPGGILVGTEMALIYLNQKVENSVVVSIDSYFSIPDYQINEKIFHILISIKSISQKNFLIQTRQDKTKIFDYAIRGNFVDFFRDEIEDRKEIGYPPFTTYIKITISGEKQSVRKQMADIAEFLKPFEMMSFDAWNPEIKNKFTMHGLITLQRGKWVDPELLSKLKGLPPNCTIKVDPMTLL